MDKKLNPVYTIIFLGDSQVGKTSTFLQYTDNIYSDSGLTTIGIESKIRKITFKDKNDIEHSFDVKIVDTSGQERFRTITSNYYKNADGVILMFDVTNKESFEHISNWCKEIKEKSKNDIEILIVGNKIDLPNRYKSKNEFENNLKEQNLLYEYEEISAKTKENVVEMITNFIAKIYDIKGAKIITTKTKLQKTNKKKTCCG